MGGAVAVFPVIVQAVHPESGRVKGLGFGIHTVMGIDAAGLARLFQMVAVGLVPIVVGYGRAERTGARVDHQIQAAVASAVQLDEVVPSAQRAETAECPLGIHRGKTPQRSDGQR